MYWKCTAALRNPLTLCWASKQLNQNEAEGNIPFTRHGVFAFAASVRRDRKQSEAQSSVAQLQSIPLCFVSYQCDSYLSLAPDFRVFNEDLCHRFLWHGGMLIPNREERYEWRESPS